MKLILVGPPGSGKGTQAEKIKEQYDVVHISTGELFRENIKNQTELGKKAKELIEKGELVPDEITIEMVKERLLRDDCSKGYLLDGFPRTIPQAEILDKEQDIDIVIDIEVPDEEIIERITGRRKGSDGNIYHVKYNPAPKGIEVNQREDDTEEVVKNRLKVYHQQTEPIINHYKNKEKVSVVDGTKKIDDVWQDIKTILDKKDNQ